MEASDSSGAPGLRDAPAARELAFVALLLAAFAVQSGSSMLLHSASADEAAHLAGGYSQLRTGVPRLNREHPPLVKVLAALPLLAMDLEGGALAAQARNQWQYGRTLLYANDADRVLLWARLPLLGLALALGFVVWRFSRDLFGPSAGLVSLFLFAFSPNFLAHSHFVTFDVPLAFFMLASTHALWAFFARRRRRDLILAGLLAGGAMATKFSGVLLIPALGLASLWLPRVWRRLPARRPDHPGLFVAGALAAVTAIALATVWATYGLPADPLFYVDGMARVNANRVDHPTYLVGEFLTGRVPSYFVFTSLFKTPEVILLGLLASAAFLAVRRDRPPGIGFLATPPVVFFVATSLLAAPLGHRYVLPAFAFVLVFIGQLAQLPLRRSTLAVAALALGLWHAGWTLAIWPDHVAYFNQVSGGAARGRELLADSNLDWGHNVKRVRAWAERTGTGAFFWLDPFPSSDPAYYGLEARPLSREAWAASPPAPGTYVLNVHSLVYGRDLHRRLGLATDWLDRYEPVDRVGYAYLVYRFPDTSEPRVQNER